MSDKPVKDSPIKVKAIKDGHDYETTGHSWDGIEEYNKPLPKWWLYTFYACILWGIGYSIAFPAWPGIKAATPGLLGYSTRGEVAEDIAAFDAANAEINAQLASVDLAVIDSDRALHGYALNAGASVFRTWCAQCHGSAAEGALGYPNLQDDAWLWGGSLGDIHYTVSHGIRNEVDFDARFSEMPAFGRDELLSDAEIEQVSHFVLSLSDRPHEAALASTGAEVFEYNCAACHAEDGSGNRDQGAPNLADAIWLYGGDLASVTETVTNARFGVMPAWSTRLSEAEVRAVSAYVHSLGGGE